MQTVSPAQYDASKDLIRSMSTIAPMMETEVRGVNAADRLATLLVAHRDPETLEWKNAQKNAKKNIISDTINKIIPNLNPN